MGTNNLEVKHGSIDVKQEYALEEIVPLFAQNIQHQI